MCYAINNTVKVQYKQCAQIQYVQLQVCAINKCATEKVRKYNVRNCIVLKTTMCA